MAFHGNAGAIEMENQIPIEELLFEEEGTTLDFKREQYVFSAANDYQKSEIIKDILAFANAWRRSDAYILLGVEEIKGGRSKPLGVTNELDDAQLQQLVNSKTQRPITFTYQTLLIDGVKIGAIKIPVQSRPYYVEKDFGKLKKHVVYVRRGSSTDEANPDEVCQMGRAEVTTSIEIPHLSFEFASSENRSTQGIECSFEAVLLNIPSLESVPDYRERSSDPFGLTGLAGPRTNTDFYREMVTYYYVLKKSKALSFSLTNNSTVTVSDVRVEILIEKQGNKFTFFHESDFPDFPKSNYNLLANMEPLSVQLSKSTKPTIRLQDLGESYRIEVPFLKAQPKQTVFFEQSIFVAANEDFQVQAQVIIYADNVSLPIKSSLIVDCKVRNESVELDDLKQLHSQAITDKYTKESTS